jgi:hypothetical protein
MARAKTPGLEPLSDVRISDPETGPASEGTKWSRGRKLGGGTYIGWHRRGCCRAATAIACFPA